MLRPFARRSACFAHDPFAYLQNQAGLLGQWNKFCRTDHAALGVVPADQSLEPFQLFPRETVKRLEIELEAAVFYGQAKIKLHLPADTGLFIERRLEEMEVRFAPTLGPVERKVSMLQKVDAGFAVYRRDGHAHAGRTIDRMAADLYLLGKAVLDMLSDREQTFVLVLDHRKNGELVPAQPRNPRIAEFGVETRGNLPKQGIACWMAQRIVDHLEIVEIAICD